MQLSYYPKIESINDIIKHKFRAHPQSSKLDWAVTELLDGDHLALYADASKGFFRASTRRRFLEAQDTYSDWKECVALHKPWAVEFSKAIKSPIIVYGKMVGGHYKGESKGINIKSVCDYSIHNDFIIHDIKLFEGFIAMHELDNLAQKYSLSIAPVLYHGDFAKATCFPENKLSAVPFLYDLPIKFDNEMKGIVVRPVYDLTHQSKRVIIKKLNRTYIGKKDKSTKTNITDTLVEIAAYMDCAAVRLNVLEAVLIAVGKFSYGEIDKLAGRYVKGVLNTVNYIKYNLLTNDEKHLVNKELNKIATDKLLKLHRAGVGEDAA